MEPFTIAESHLHYRPFSYGTGGGGPSTDSSKRKWRSHGPSSGISPFEKNQDEIGYFGKDGGRMYGHGIVTLTLAEMLGMGLDEKMDDQIREKCQSAIDLILRSQKVQKNQAQQGGTALWSRLKRCRPFRHYLAVDGSPIR